MSYPAGKEERSFTVPKEVERIYAGAFFGCRNLEEILVEEGNRQYESVDGVLIDKKEEKYECRTLIAYPCARGAQEYVVPDGIERIGNNAFAYSELERIVCNADVTDIGYRGFFHCELLESVEGMEQVEYIYSDWFEGCYRLEKIEAGAGTKEISLSGEKMSQEIELAGLAELRGLESLWLSDMKICNMEDMSNLENLFSLSVYGKDGEIDLNSLADMKGLKNLAIEVQEMNNLSWITGMEKLTSLSIRGKNLNISDLSPLMQLDKLTYVSIWDSSGKLLNEESKVKLQEQLEELRETHPDCSYAIFDLD